MRCCTNLWTERDFTLLPNCSATSGTKKIPSHRTTSIKTCWRSSALKKHSRASVTTFKFQNNYTNISKKSQYFEIKFQNIYPFLNSGYIITLKNEPPLFLSKYLFTTITKSHFHFCKGKISDSERSSFYSIPDTKPIPFLIFYKFTPILLEVTNAPDRLRNLVDDPGLFFFL